jgi:hypothetical protein
VVLYVLVNNMLVSVSLQAVSALYKLIVKILTEDLVVATGESMDKPYLAQKSEPSPLTVFLAL